MKENQEKKRTDRKKKKWYKTKHLKMIFLGKGKSLKDTD